MKRASYKEAIEWIALNDAIDSEEPIEEVRSVVTVALIADIFGKTRSEVADDVVRFIKKHRKGRE